MLDSTLELISQAASNSLLVFCFCNLIIVIILVGLKPVSTAHQQVNNRNSNPRGGGEAAPKQVKNSMVKNDLIEGVLEESNAQKAADDVDDEGRNRNNDNDGHGNDRDEKEEDDDDDELRKKVEEFIEKVNEGWKAEVLTSLKTSI
ncbi:hypothetical protein FEM48_Zijuj03G0143000 [Ziziphus jujuba var. spinosa]|uniref:Uncharacterized protein n=1 Tax=Ziziphus jujuba var. spinosa TaxID=714518 RepID=A0A978VQT5_ZIZJJ|nr:hypothetical protein FEM48_Zijuj03G0143000 [Ziziphus jujuba var. spinosa]